MSTEVATKSKSEKSKTVKKSKTDKPKVVRPRKLLSDNIQGLSKPAIARLCKRAGVVRIDNDVYSTARSILENLLRGYLEDIVMITEYNRRATIYVNDINAALDMRGITLAAGFNEHAKHSAALRSCNSKGTSGPRRVKKEGSAEKKAHRYRPGTVARRSVKYQQEHSDCLSFPRLNFERIIRELLQKIRSDRESDFRLEDGVVELLQLTCETYFVNLCESALAISIRADHKTLMGTDLNLVLKIRGVVPFAAVDLTVPETKKGGSKKAKASKEEVAAEDEE